MDCSQVLPGAVNPGPCSVATGYYCDNPFIVYASGKDVVIVDGHLTHIQTVQGDVAIRSLHCSEGTGKIAVAWETDVVIFNPEPHEDSSEASSADLSAPVTTVFPGEWRVYHTLHLKHPVDSLCWNREGTQLLVGGKSVSLWTLELPPQVLAAEVLPEREMGDMGGEGMMGGGVSGMGTWNEVWRCEVAIPVVHLKFSPDSTLFATAGENDRLVKLWYQPVSLSSSSASSSSSAVGSASCSLGTSRMFSFTYVAHPRAVTGFVWRRTSRCMPKGCVANVLLTYCKDNICRLWSHSLSGEYKNHFRFYIVASIDPIADIPFRTTMPLNNLPFVVHWLNNKETIFTSKASKYQRGTFTPVSHHSSIQSFTGLNDEVLQSWVCIDETGDGRQITTSLMPNDIVGLSAAAAGAGGGTEPPGARMQELHGFASDVHHLSPGTAAARGGAVGGASGTAGGTSSPVRPGSALQEGSSRVSVAQKRAYAHLMDEWNTSPDLLICIHPSVGSLMVWTVEGLDAPTHASRLVHISFSSCLPHIFPPHLAQTLRQELLQFLIREQDAVHPRASSEEGGTGSLSLPVPQIRLSSSGSMATMSHLQGSEDVPKVRPESILILVSSHVNGSLNTWSVEITEQSNSSTSIAGLIHCAGTGGHHSVVRAICRHPWLPILITVSSNKAVSSHSPLSREKSIEDTAREVESDGTCTQDGDTSGGETEDVVDVKSELIIWNSDLPGPLKHESRLNELSRMLSHDPDAFRYVTWAPPISVGGLKEDAFARCPSSGLFVANIGSRLCLFQTSLYSITKPQPTSFMNDATPTSNSAAAQGGTAAGAPSRSQSGVGPTSELTITSQLGKEGISLVSVIEPDLSKFDQIMGLHTFRMCSLVTSFEVKKSLDSKFCKDIIVVLIENQLPPGIPPPDPNQATSPGPKSTNTLLHMWQVTVCAEVKEGGSSPFRTNWDSIPSRQESGGSSSIYMQQVVYSASVKKVYSSPLPIPVGCHVVQSSPACDISSSLQLQLPTLSSPFLFSTACSDGTIRCWQFSLKYLKSSSSQEEEAAVPVNGDKDASCECTCHDSEDNLEFELFEVFGASSQGRRFDPALSSSSNCLDCREEDTIKSLPTQSFIPSAITNAYPGRFAMAHLLTKPVTTSAAVKESPRRSSSYQGFSRNVSVSSFMKEANPFNRYAVVSIWECESSGGLKWACETTLLLSGPAEFTGSQSAGRSTGVHMEWLPMENGAYLLACCFASTIFVFGMALPTNEDQFTSMKKLQNRFTMNQKVATLQKSKARASWVCLLQFPFSKLSVSQTVSHFAYTGSNSLLLSCGRQMHLYSCWVRTSHLSALFTTSKGLIVDNSDQLLREVTPASASEGSQLPSDPDSCINLLDYAHICNTPLSQHHPKILMELMNSGHLHAVNVILVNLVKYLLLYCEKKRAKGNYFDEGGFEAYYGEGSTQTEQGKRKRLLSVTEDGQLRRSQHFESKVLVESIPQVPLSKLKILKSKSELASEANDDAVLNEEDTDDAFLTTSAAGLDGMTYKFGEDEENTPELCFSDLGPETPKFTPDMAERLSTILENMQLSDLTDVEQVRLIAIAETVANTKLSFGAAGKGSKPKPYADPESGPSAMNFGVGYASVSLSHGVKGGEAMDDCGLRYLLALENYISLSKSLPSSVSAGHLMPSDIIWAFHSDAEAELLAALPCVQKDELNWKDLKDAGVGWWVRSSDLLRRLIEKLAKAQFMQKQEPLDAGLFYLAMKKQTLMKGLFKTVSNNKMMTFFGNNFSSERWKKAALKNAFVLLGMQRFEHAAAFFLLAGKLWDAVEVCVSRLEDLQLALVITRLYEGDNGDVYQRLLKECILGVSAGTSQSRLEASSDPFLRSMAHWLLQDYSASLETFLQHPESSGKQQNSRILAVSADDEENSHVLNPAIFNFYYYLRSHPVLIRRDYASQKSLLSGVGEEPLTPPERNLLFGTAYYHLSHGCPLLALNVLSKLPKDCDLGLEVAAASDKRTLSGKGKSAAKDLNTRLTVIKENMIQSGTLGDDFSFGPKDADMGEPDWSKPISSKLDDDFDWSKPVSSMYSGGGGRFGEDENEFDWSKPVSSTKLELNDGELSPPHFSSSSEEGSETQLDDGGRSGGKPKKVKTLSSRGIFILSLGEQLQYNACLSILTEELNTIVIPACCSYLWMKKGPRYLPLLPLKKPGREKRSLTAQFQDDAFEKTVLQLRGDLVQWLKDETQAVKDICGFDKSGEEDEESTSSKDGSDTNLAVVEVTGNNSFKDDSSERYTAPAGYDLLTTLMNYTALHAATSPSLLTVKLELMHLMNSLLPWSTGFQPGVIIQEPEGSLSQSITDFDASGSSGTSYAVDPAQLPILTSSSLPVRHLTNLALHLRLMSGSIVDVLTQHNHPPISSQPLSSVDRIFELCCAISHCLKVCLSPIRFSEFTAAGATTLGSTGPSPSLISQPLASPSATSLGSFSPGVTPTQSGVWSDPHQQLTQIDGGKLSVPTRGSPSPRFARRKEIRDSGADQILNKPNTKPSKWPGIAKWPSKLTSDEGKDPTPLSLVLVECLVSVYLGLFSVAWSRHSIEDIHILLRNFPSGDMWYSAFGGGIIVKKAEDEKSKRSKSLMQRVEAMTKRFKLIRKTSIEAEGEGTSPGLFVAPSKSLLYHYLSEPSEEEGDRKGKRFSRVASEDARDFCVVDDEGEETEKEDEEWEDEDDQDEFYMQGEGPMFRIGAIRSESVDHDHDPNNPNCFAWCLMNLCIAKILQSSIRKILNTAGLEVLELVIASPLLYSTLKLMEQWELTFTRRLEALGPAPDDLFGDKEEAESPMFRNGPPIMRHKSILEQDHTPFNRSKTKSARRAKHLWTYLASLVEVRDTFIHYIFSDKPVPPPAATTATPTLSSLDEEGGAGMVGGGGSGGGERTPSTPSIHSLSHHHHHHERVIIIHREMDSIVSSFCVNSCSRANATQLAIALPREVLEIEVPDTSFLESNHPYGDSQPASGTTSPKRSLSLAKMFAPSDEEFVMVPHTASTPTQGGILKRPQSMIFPLSLGASRPPPAVNLHIQTGSNSSMMLKRQSAGVKRMAQHPSLAYYLTGSIDGSVVMWEFGTPHHVSVQRSPGTGASVTKIRFTPEGNKYGVTDSSGKLSLWQGIHTYTQSPYQMLTSGMKSLGDFLFLGSSSLIAACGDGNDNRNLILWDTLMPTNRGIVRDFMCHDGGATSLGYSRSRQRLICGGRRGEVCIFDIRQYSLLQVLQVHSSSVNCIAVNDIDGYFVTGAADGEIKVIDSSTLDEIATYPMMHSKSRLFRHSETGVTGLDILPGGKLFSCGVDGTVKCRTITL